MQLSARVIDLSSRAEPRDLRFARARWTLMANRRSFVGLGLAFFLVAMVASLHAAEPDSRPLNSAWEFRAVNAAAHPEVSGWHQTQVPGVVQTDLFAAHLIPDPFYGDNESHLQWIGLTDWEYRTTFQIDSSTLQHEHVDLVFDGLDTFADVFLNDQPILTADNMFRRWRVAVRPLLKPGPNTLRVVFHSPITSMIPKVKALPYILPSVSTVNEGNEENVATAPYTRKAAYQYGWDWGPRFITIGIWKPVWLESWDDARIENFHIHQLKITRDVAELAAELEIESSRPMTATIAVEHDDAGGALKPAVAQAVQLDAGTNHVSLPLRIASPKLWYPAGYGAQDRYRFIATVKMNKSAVAQRRCQNRPALCRTPPRARSMGQELHLCGERNSGFRQRREPDPVRQLPQPRHAGALSRDPAGRARRQHEHGARMGRRHLRKR